jgi:hypothetical protein
MIKSARVTLTVVAAVGCAARGALAQAAQNPCGPANFNEKACYAAVKSHGYCSGGTWVAQQYQQYPYYYDLYRVYASAGGMVIPAAVERCGRGGHAVYGGFGSHGVAHGAAGS